MIHGRKLGFLDRVLLMRFDDGRMMKCVSGVRLSILPLFSLVLVIELLVCVVRLLNIEFWMLIPYVQSDGKCYFSF